MQLFVSIIENIQIYVNYRRCGSIIVRYLLPEAESTLFCYGYFAKHISLSSFCVIFQPYISADLHPCLLEVEERYLLFSYLPTITDSHLQKLLPHHITKVSTSVCLVMSISLAKKDIMFPDQRKKHLVLLHHH